MNRTRYVLNDQKRIQERAEARVTNEVLASKAGEKRCICMRGGSPDQWHASWCPNYVKH